MSKNLTFPLTEGEVGALMTFWLTYEDENGVEQPYNLTGKDLFLRAWREDPVGRTIDDAECVPDPDQTWDPVTKTGNRGKATYTFDSTTANIAVDTHFFRFKSVDGGGNVRWFPKDSEGIYGTIVVSADF